MDHQAQHRMGLHDTAARLDGDVVTRLDAEGGLDLQMHIGRDQVAHAAGAQLMHPDDAGRGGQRGVNGLDLVGLDRAVHQIVDRIPAEGPAHAGHQEADDQRRDRIEQGIAGQVARDAQSHHQRGRRIRA